MECILCLVYIQIPLADEGPRTEMSCIVDVSMLCQVKKLKKKRTWYINIFSYPNVPVCLDTQLSTESMFISLVPRPHPVHISLPVTRAIYWKRSVLLVLGLRPRLDVHQRICKKKTKKKKTALGMVLPLRLHQKQSRKTKFIWGACPLVNIYNNYIYIYTPLHPCFRGNRWVLFSIYWQEVVRDFAEFLQHATT